MTDARYTAVGIAVGLSFGCGLVGYGIYRGLSSACTSHHAIGLGEVAKDAISILREVSLPREYDKSSTHQILKFKNIDKYLEMEKEDVMFKQKSD